MAARKPDIVRVAQRELEAARVLRDQISALAEGDEDFVRDTLEGETDLDGLVGSLVASIGEDGALTDSIDAYEAKIAARRKRIEDRIAFKRTLIASALEIAGRPTIETPAGTVTLKAIPPKAIQNEPADIPAEFWKPQPPKVDAKALLAALKEGRQVPGASLGNGGTTISIRRA